MHTPRYTFNFWIPVFLLLTTLTLVGYAQAFQVSFLSDDYHLLLFAKYGPNARSLFQVNPTPWSHFHRPFGWLVWKVLLHIWGDYTPGYHLFSLLLHALNSTLVVAFALRLLTGNRVLSISAGILFALFPVHIETVVWLSALYDLLATACYLTTLLLLFSAVSTKRFYLYLLSLAVFQIGIWSKESIFTLPLIAIIFGLALLKRSSWRLLILGTIPYGLLIGMNFFQRYLVWNSIGGYPDAPSNYTTFVLDRLEATLKTLLAPVNLSLAPAEVNQLLLLVMLCIFFCGLIAGRNRRNILLAFIWIGITLIPVLNVLPVGRDLQNSRLLYLPAVGFCISVVLFVDNIIYSILRSYRRFAFSASIAIFAVCYMVVLFVQIRPWVVASHASESITHDIHALIRQPRHASILHVVDLPDNYQGAYMTRNGFDVALFNKYGVFLNWWPNRSPEPIPYEALDLKHNDFYQFDLVFQPEQKNWTIESARAVTRIDQSPLYDQHYIYNMHAEQALATKPVAPQANRVYNWNMKSCPGTHRNWQIQNAYVTCQPGLGLKLDPISTDPHLISPRLHLSQHAWIEVAVTMQTIHPSGERDSFQLLWLNVKQNGWNEQVASKIELPSESSKATYHFYIPPESVGEGLTQLRLDPVKTFSPVLISQVEVYIFAPD